MGAREVSGEADLDIAEERAPADSVARALAGLVAPALADSVASAAEQALRAQAHLVRAHEA